jgi:hypothetical protein
MKRWWNTSRHSAPARNTRRRVGRALMRVVVAGAVSLPIPSHAAGDQVLNLGEASELRQVSGRMIRTRGRRCRQIVLATRRPAMIGPSSPFRYAGHRAQSRRKGQVANHLVGGGDPFLGDQAMPLLAR